MKCSKLFYFFILVFVIGCNNIDTKLEILDAEKMKVILLDFHTVEANIANQKLSGDSLAKTYRKNYSSIFAKHKINAVLFKKSLHYYTNKPNELDEIYTEIIQELNHKN
jgi:hypothetical protein